MIDVPVGSLIKRIVMQETEMGNNGHAWQTDSHEHESWLTIDLNFFVQAF